MGPERPDRLRPCAPRLAAALLLLASAWPLRAGAPTPSRPTDPPPLRDRLAAAVGDYQRASRATVGAAVVHLRSGRTLLALRADEPHVPASNQKLLTAAFALVRLGAAFEFETAAHRVGDDLWVVGAGDPTFGDPRLADRGGRSIYHETDRWAEAIAEAFGGQIDGNLVVHSGFTPDQARPLEGFRHPSWPARHRHCWYAAPVAGVSFNNNCYDVTFAARGGGIVPVVSPASGRIRVIDRTRRGREQRWSLTSAPDESAVSVRGRVKTASPYPLSVAANNPPMLFGRVLADRLERAGCAVRGRVRVAARCAGGAGGLGEPICRTRAPLAAVLRRTNKTSLNMAAECVFLRAGDGTWAGSARAMTRTLRETFALPDGSLAVSDGSGLSADNRVTADAMVRVLAGVLRHKGAAMLLNSLPVSGVDGTMRRRLRRRPYRGRVVAKTGYVRGASALSGYVLGRDWRPAVAFAVLAGRVPTGRAWRAKALQDAVCRMLVDSLDDRPDPDRKTRAGSAD
jgi:D-alanyl-D-alanine carboxypeptidase/D-alanyl-D-alanine-endopeptidase (penicillin-binding protein 4)